VLLLLIITSIVCHTCTQSLQQSLVTSYFVILSSCYFSVRSLQSAVIIHVFTLFTDISLHVIITSVCRSMRDHIYLLSFLRVITSNNFLLCGHFCQLPLIYIITTLCTISCYLYVQFHQSAVHLIDLSNAHLSLLHVITSNDRHL